MTETLSSARALRSQYRQAERTSARLRLLNAAGMAFWSHGASSGALTEILKQALAFSALDSAVLLSYDEGMLSVRAAAGPFPPTGTRIAPQGALVLALKPPACLVLRQDVVSSVAIGRSVRVAQEWLLPLCFGGHMGGLLVFNGMNPSASPDKEDLEALQALAGVLASALAGASSGAMQAGLKSTSGGKNATAEAVLNVLTPRERQVFALLPRALTNAAMAEQLGIAPGTVKVHIERILFKLGLRDRTQAAVWATQQGYGT